MNSSVKNSADPEQVKDSKRKAREAAAADSKAIAGLMASPEGRGFLFRLMTRCHLFELSFNGDMNQTILREGERNVGNWLLTKMNAADPMHYPNLLIEQAKAIKAEKPITPKENDDDSDGNS